MYLDRLRGLSLLLLFALTMVAIAGCLGESEGNEVRGNGGDQDPDDDEPEGNRTAEDEKRSKGDAGPRVSRFTFPLESPVEEETWINGSFSPEETGVGGGFATGGFVKEVDLSDLVPAEVPVHVEVSVWMDAEEVTLVGPTSRADPQTNATVWYELDAKKPGPGRLEIDGVVKRSDDGVFHIVLEAYTPGPDGPPEVAYSVHATARARPDEVPAAVPVAMVLRGNETVAFESLAENHAEVLIYGPDDGLVHRLYFPEKDNWTVPVGLEGEFVAMSVPGSGAIQIGKELTGGEEGNEGKPAGTLRALGLRREEGEPRAVESQGMLSWSFEADRRPLRVMAGVVGPGGAPWLCTGALSIRVDSPEGTVFERTVECPSPTNAPFLYEEVWSWASRLGDPRLVAGSYEVVVEADLWWGHQAHHGVEWVER